MAIQTVLISIDTDALSGLTDEYLASLWHVAQANPAPIEDVRASDLAEAIGREIIRRFLAATPPILWHHQGAHETIALREKLAALNSNAVPGASS